MRELDSEDMLSVRTLAEVHIALREDTERLRRLLGWRNETSDGKSRPASKSYTTTAALCAFLSRPWEERVKDYVRGREIEDGRLAMDAPIPFGEDSARPEGPSANEQDDARKTRKTGRKPA